MEATFVALAAQNAELHGALREKMPPELARAWRTWAAVSRLSNQLEMLRRQMLIWRSQQLREEEWMSQVESVLTAARPANDERIRAARRDGAVSQPPGEAHLTASRASVPARRWP